LIGTVHHTLLNVGEKAPELLEPAVPVTKSVQPDYIVCLEDGKKFKTLKRHLKTAYDLSPKEYRQKWGLSDDYPMVAPNYAALRRELAKKIRLGKGAPKRRSGNR
jgi:predicted transcriptional regulator